MVGTSDLNFFLLFQLSIVLFPRSYLDFCYFNQSVSRNTRIYCCYYYSSSSSLLFCFPHLELSEIWCLNCVMFLFFHFSDHCFLIPFLYDVICQFSTSFSSWCSCYQAFVDYFIHDLLIAIFGLIYSPLKYSTFCCVYEIYFKNTVKLLLS